MKIPTPYDIVAAMIAAMYLLHIADAAIFRNRLRELTLRPRTLAGLVGALNAPWLHGGWLHLIGNTVPLAILSSLTLYESPRGFVLATIFGIVVGGGAAWLVARPSTHLGASGLVYAYFGYLLASGYYNKGAIIVSLIVWVVFGRMLRGVLPQRKGISFEVHLFGFLGGCLAARVLAIRPMNQHLIEAGRWVVRHHANWTGLTGAIVAIVAVQLLITAALSKRTRLQA